MSRDGVVEIYRSSQYLDPAASLVLFISVSPLLSGHRFQWITDRRVLVGGRRVLTVRNDIVESVALLAASIKKSPSRR